MEKNLRQFQEKGDLKIIKIALFGPESTGKTTLAKQLAKHYKTNWVPEFARDYLQEKWDSKKEICDIDDMLPIAIGQTKLENEGTQKANTFLFCDTNLLVTKVFSEVYYNFCDPELDRAARKHKYDLFFLTDIDVPWEKDDLRDKAEGRESVFAVFKQSLIDNKKPFITLTGDQNSRINKATAIINDLVIAQKLGFSSLDFVQIYEHGIPILNIQKQMEILKRGITKIDLVGPATLSNGIVQLSEGDFKQKVTFYDENKTNLKLKKFVPASGAASRMFQFLTAFISDFKLEQESINAYINRKKDTELPVFLVGMEKFPFYEQVYAKLKEEIFDFDILDRDTKNYNFIKLLLSSDFFDFANKPKAVLPFHNYSTHIAAPIEEHLFECANYARAKGDSYLHFTVSEKHQNQFETTLKSILNKVETQTKTAIKVSYSYQNQKTDTITVDLKNNPFRDENGKLVFRPGGHGALIDNLNNLNADIVFIKNIDNVFKNNIEKISFYKKGLAGILLEFQQQLFHYLNAIETAVITTKDLEEIIIFLNEKLNIELKSDFYLYTFENQISKIFEILNRPIRVCGMVKNEGEPGGGPFWVRDEKGNITLQIVESTQVDLHDENQLKIVKSATHFNPVDLVCGIRDYKRKPFDLIQFIDDATGFIVQKNSKGQDYKAYELPGLWNGGMAKWITIFVEVPLLTFNPVKTVNDLLKPAHQ